MRHVWLSLFLCGCTSSTPATLQSSGVAPPGCYTSDIVGARQVDGRVCNARWRPEHLPLVLVTAQPELEPDLWVAADLFNTWLGLEVFTVVDGPGYHLPVSLKDKLTECTRVGQAFWQYMDFDITSASIDIKRGQGPDQRLWVIMHEMGHALALHHTDTSTQCSVMNPKVTLSCAELTEEHLLTLRNLYTGSASVLR